MVNRPKYDDFVQVGSTTKRFHDTDVSFVQFSCPMDGCNELVNVRDDEVDRRKSTRCLEHLKKCKSFAAAAGRQRAFGGRGALLRGCCVGLHRKSVRRGGRAHFAATRRRVFA